jgi:hypothetical protein
VLDVRVGLGADFDRLTPEPGTMDASAALTPARWSDSLVATAGVAVGAGAGRHLALELRLTADVLPTAVHYDLATDGRAAPAFSPWRVRPGLALALMIR